MHQSSFDDMTEQEYNIQIDYIFNRFPSFQKVGAAAYKPGIESVKALVEQLGNPHRRFRSVHIAGTNGKGSTSHMIAAALASTGLKVGLFTSPHLIDFRERIKTSTPSGNFEMVSRDFVYNFIKDNRQRFEDLNVSFFEITTAMAFCWFADCNTDIAVIECGLGGRLDSTNIITPILSVITNIGLDHCALLGNTTEKIAAEKAGIIKPGVPVVIGEASGVAKVFKDKAEDEGSRIYFAEDFDLPEEPFEETLRNMDLGGACQRRNLRTVLTSLNILNPLIFNTLPHSGDGTVTSGVNAPALCKSNLTFPHSGDSAGIPGGTLPELCETAFEGTIASEEMKAVMTAARKTGLHGRWEVLNRNPFIVCDTGHNPHGFALLGKQIQDEFEKWQERRSGARLLMIFGVMADKDLDSIVDFLPKNAEYIFVAPATPRAMKAAALKEKMTGLGFKAFNSYNSHCRNVSDMEPQDLLCESGSANESGNIWNSLSQYKKIKGDEDFVFIGGSTFVVAEALEWFAKNKI